VSRSCRPRDTRWSTPSGWARPASPRPCSTGTTTCSPWTRSSCGGRRPSSPRSATAALRARACDDKGQVYMHVAAIRAHLAVNGKLPINLKCVIEARGGGQRAPRRVPARAAQPAGRGRHRGERTACSAPTSRRLCYGLRGLLYTQIDVTGRRATCTRASSRRGAEPRQRPVRDHRRAQGRWARHVPVLRPGEAAHGRPSRDVLARVAVRRGGLPPRGRLAGGFAERGYTTLERVWVRPIL